MIVIQVAGRLGRDPESRFTASGQKVTSLSLATTIKRSGKEETVWWRITLWGDRFDKLLPHLKKGSALIVIGEMGRPPEIYTDKEGKQQVSLELTAEIVRFSPFGGGQERPAQQEHQQSQATPTGFAEVAQVGVGPYSNQDEMPF